jgi:hypothetical protein
MFELLSLAVAPSLAACEMVATFICSNWRTASSFSIHSLMNQPGIRFSEKQINHQEPKKQHSRSALLILYQREMTGALFSQNGESKTSDEPQAKNRLSRLDTLWWWVYPMSANPPWSTI